MSVIHWDGAIGVTEASDMGWRAGCWPPHLDAEVPSTMAKIRCRFFKSGPINLADSSFGGYIYKSAGGRLVKVFND